jgi:hypothetical protein
MGLDRLTPKLQASSNSCLATAARETVRHYVQWDSHVGSTYDPDLPVAFNAAMAAPLPELWPQFDAGEVLPLAVTRGAGSDVLARATVVEMLRRSLDMIHGEIRDLGHIPVLDEEDAILVVLTWLDQILAEAGADG